ncbi:MAG TPA: hypothetical protein VM008_09275 [Phycisphaerae bacterium]|nr:hypothetical protein [Phycisphaerae bacterium]
MDADSKIPPAIRDSSPPPPAAVAPVSSTTPPPPPPELSYATPEELDHPQDWTNVEVFTLDPAQRNRFILQVAILSVALRLLLLFAIATVMFLMHTEPWTIIFVVVVVCALQVFHVIRTIARTRRTWPTYRLVVADQGFISTALGRPRVRADAADIACITGTFDGYKVALRGGRHITLPRRVLNVEALPARLQTFQPITPGRGSLGLATQIASVWVVTLITVIIFYIGLFTHQPRTTLICAAVSCPLVAFTMWQSLRVKGLPVRAWIASISLVVFPLLLVLRWVVVVYIFKL